PKTDSEMRRLTVSSRRLSYQSNSRIGPDKTRRTVLLRLAVVAATAFVAVQVYLWGAAIRPRYRIDEVRTVTGGVAAEWVIAPADSPSERWIARDANGDGTWNEVDTPQGAFAR